MQGKLVVIEGSDGSGKTTQLELLRAYFEKNNIPHIAFDFPQYADTFHAKTIAKYLSGEYGDPEKQNPYLVSLAYALDRITIREEIYYALNDGKIVLANRYVPSNKAYQGAKLSLRKRGEFFKWLDELEYSVNKLPREDLVIFLYVSHKIAAKLVRERGKKFIGEKPDLHEESSKLQIEAEKNYLRLARDKNWIKINCVDKKGTLLSKRAIHSQILSSLSKAKII